MIDTVGWILIGLLIYGYGLARLSRRMVKDNKESIRRWHEETRS